MRQRWNKTIKDEDAMCNLFLKPLSKPLPHRERGFDSCSPSLFREGVGGRECEKVAHGVMKYEV
jgi:hypothetical protein